MKIVPVDINLFPGGFNNFADKVSCVGGAFRDYMANFSKVGLVVENFTRNENYLKNCAVLKEALLSLGLQVDLLTIDSLKVVKFAADNNQAVDLADLDLIMLNNDLTAGCPPELMALREKVVPDPSFGWYNRRKHVHLGIYNQLIDEMFNDLNIDYDPWFFNTFIDRCDNINFRERIGLEELAVKVEKVLGKIRAKYEEHQIREQPHVFVKANSGSFGMSVMVVKSPDEIMNINKKIRHGMSMLKQGVKNADVVIQEGVRTNLKIFDAPCENVLYNVCGTQIGKLTRYNINKNDEANLNSVGMKIAVQGECDIVDVVIASLSDLSVNIEGKMIRNL